MAVNSYTSIVKLVVGATPNVGERVAEMQIPLSSVPDVHFVHV